MKITGNEYFPEFLKARRCWVLWKLEDAKQKNGKTKKTKVPYCANSLMKRASSTNSATWATFAECYRAFHLNTNTFSGIGCVLTQEMGVICIDIDHCIDSDTGRMNQKAAEILKQFSDSYSEISQSGTGLHIFALGVVPRSFKNSEEGVELYCSGRFIAMTGDSVTHCDIINKQAAISEIFSKYKTPEPIKECPEDRKPLPLNIDDTQIIQKASRANPKFIKLYFNADGWAEWFGSQSEADLCLCGTFAFWCNRDPEVIDRLFRSSALYRSKWDEKHGADTYGNMTIKRAIAGCSECYSEFLERKEHERKEKRRRYAQWLLNH